jgi:hypothetical protein
LDVTKTRPEEVRFWNGYERGVIECSSCGFATPDDCARRGKIQKCAQCAKVLYIPSGLYRPLEVVGGNRVRYVREKTGILWKIGDAFGARLNRMKRSKYRLPIFFAIIVIGLAILVGLYQFKQASVQVAEVPSALNIYYEKMVVMNKDLKKAEEEYDRGVGGIPAVEEFGDRSTTGRERFIRNTNRILTTIEGYLNEMHAMGSTVPEGAESHYAKMLARLAEMQKFYARLKDGANDKNEVRWKEAFANQPALRDARSAEERALNLLQPLVLRPTNAKTTK